MSSLKSASSSRQLKLQLLRPAMASRVAAVVSLTCAFALLDPLVVAVPTPAAAVGSSRVRDDPPARGPPQGYCGADSTELRVVELAKTDQNVPANDTVGGGLVFANPVSIRRRFRLTVPLP